MQFKAKLCRRNWE